MTEQDLKVVGQSVLRRDGLGQVTGKTLFVDDRSFPDMLHLKMVRSPVPHAHIRSIDFSAAERVPGFVRALTYKDVPKNVYTILCLIGVGPDEEPVLAEDKVLYVDQPIAAVIAETEAAAMEAVSQVRLDLEELPAVFDVEEALEPGAPILKDWGTNYFIYDYEHGQSNKCRKVRLGVVEKGFAEGWIAPQPPAARTGRTVAVVGSGPAGLAAAQQLNRAGHGVTVFERAGYLGGLLRLGIPEFKLAKRIVDRRVELLRAEGVEFRTGVNVGADLSAADLRRDFDALVLAGGSTLARDLQIPGRELKGIHLATAYLSQQNRILAGEKIRADEIIAARGKRVVVLGGGDTGADCLGTAHRQGAAETYQFELLPEPPKERQPDNPWPYWPPIMRTSSSHEEGGIRDYSILTKQFSGRRGRVEKLHAVRLSWGPPDGSGRLVMNEIPGSEFEIAADLVLLALGFVSPAHHGMLKDLGVGLDQRGNVAVDGDMMTSVPGVFAAGDMARGQSLVVWAIALGREAARGVDLYLMGSTNLPPSASTVGRYVGR